MLLRGVMKMGIHVVHFLHQGIKKWGIVNENVVRPIEKEFDTLGISISRRN